jgi:lysophospholipase L1-like esterase
MKINKKVIQTLWVIIIFLSPGLPAQKNYSFINYNLNQIIGGVMSDWTKDISGLQSGDKKTLTLLHFGGSHVQAGFWSHKFLKNLISVEKLNVKGYIFFPYAVIKSNHPPFVNTYAVGRWKKCRTVPKEFCEPLGPMGVSAFTADSMVVLRMALNKKESLMKSFKYVKIRHHISGNTYLKCTYPQGTKLNVDTNSAHIYLNEPTDSIEIQILNPDTLSNYRVFYAQFLNPDESGVVFGAMGANGASSESMNRVKNMSSFMQEIHPDWVFISYGVNDVQSKNFNTKDFYRNYDSLISKINFKNQAKILLMGITDNYIRKKGNNPKTTAGSQTIQKLASDKGYWYWPLYDVMGGKKSIQKWYKAGLAKRDRIHLNHKGYYLLADLMSDAFYQKLNEQRP